MYVTMMIAYTNHRYVHLGLGTRRGVARLVPSATLVPDLAPGCHLTDPFGQNFYLSSQYRCMTEVGGTHAQLAIHLGSKHTMSILTAFSDLFREYM